MTVTQAIRKLRDKGLTDQQIAFLVDCNPTTIWRAAKGLDMFHSIASRVIDAANKPLPDYIVPRRKVKGKAS